MTVQSDIQKAIASAQSALGAYATAEQSTEDQTAKNMYKELKSDMEKHIQYLNGRLSYVNDNNNLNSQQ